MAHGAAQTIYKNAAFLNHPIFDDVPDVLSNRENIVFPRAPIRKIQKRRPVRLPVRVHRRVRERVRVHVRVSVRARERPAQRG